MCVVRHRCEAAGAASQRAACGGWTRLRPPRAEFSRYEIRRALRIASDASGGPRRAAASLGDVEPNFAATRPYNQPAAHPLQQLASPSQPERNRFAKKLARRSVSIRTSSQARNFLAFRRSVRAREQLEREPGQKNLLDLEIVRGAKAIATRRLVSTLQLPPEYPLQCVPHSLPPRRSAAQPLVVRRGRGDCQGSGRVSTGFVGMYGTERVAAVQGRLREVAGQVD